MNAEQTALAEPNGQVLNPRAELFPTFVEGLNRAGIEYCLLSGYQNYPEAGEGDLDFMIHPADTLKLPAALNAVTRRARAQLVQAMQHETSAWHFVLAKQSEGEVTYFHPDCTTDYRRAGRLWMRAEHVLARRRRCGPFYVAAKPDEFLYYLIKKVLKREIAERHVWRLQDLYSAAAEECCEGMRRFWRAETVRQATSAILHCNVGDLQLLNSELHTELLGSAWVEGWGDRAARRVGELRRRWRRAMNPTGLGVTVWGGQVAERIVLAAALQMKLRPAFRHSLLKGDATETVWPGEQLRYMRSTLVIRTARKRPADGLTDRTHCNVGAGAHDVGSATRSVLEYMAHRVRTRELIGA